MRYFETNRKKLKSKQETLDFYLDREGECYTQLLEELHQRLEEYQQCDKNLNNRRLYEKLRIELENAYKVQEKLQQECELLRVLSKNMARLRWRKRHNSFSL